MATEHFLNPCEALGVERYESLRNVLSESLQSASRTSDAVVNELSIAEFSEKEFKDLQFEHARTGEQWAYLRLTSGNYVAVDQVPHSFDPENIAAAVIFPAIHSRLVAWWLVHNWRIQEFMECAASSLLDDWNPSVSAVSARGLLEQVGCLFYEVSIVEEAWREAKALPSDNRESRIHARFNPLLFQLAFASRGLPTSQALRPATNVQTYVDKLARFTDDERYHAWYNWLSNAAHPAVGSRIVYATQPLVHKHSRLMRRRFSRLPTSIRQNCDVGLTVVHNAADATVELYRISSHLLDFGLRIVDDFCLTTASANLTTGSSWRQLVPVRGNRLCPCGNGKWRSCGHRWGAAAPTLPKPRRES
ncbi:hypothetical protein ACUY3U_01210 [Gordonia amicalis]